MPPLNSSLIPVDVSNEQIIPGGEAGPVGPQGPQGPAGTNGSNAAALMGTFASRPAAGTAGRLYYTTDGQTVFIDNGTEWRPVIDGVIGKSPPAAANWTKITGAGGAAVFTLDDYCAALRFTWTNGNMGGEGTHVAYKAPPAAGATGYRITVHIRHLIPHGTQAGGIILSGIGFRDSSNGWVQMYNSTYGSASNVGFHEIRYTANNNGASPIYTFSAQTDLSSSGKWMRLSTGVWLRVERYNNGDRKVYTSEDGRNWRELVRGASVANTFITPNQVFLHSWISNDAAADGLHGCLFDSYEEEAF